MTQAAAIDRLEKKARDIWDTTPGDVINAVRCGNLIDDDAQAFFQEAQATLPLEHPWLNDSDPDDSLGWHWQDGEPVAEERI